MKQPFAHNFHIPVLGISFTLDTPAKVAKYGISSVIAMGDDGLIEKMRKFYSEKYNFPYSPITTEIHDYRAKRITEYLNLMQKIVNIKFDELKKSGFEKNSELVKYLEMLPENSVLKQKYEQMLKAENSQEIQKWIIDNLKLGNIDVNVMTKLDKPNFKDKEPLPSEFNEAHAAIRGFANSNLEASLVLSAGFNPRLYSYLENFKDFYPDKNGKLKKKIVLKVSDYRSAHIQGMFLAKKGIWVSEYRVESGLNCGGHAFASDGFLFGPILNEFKQNKENLVNTVSEFVNKTLVSLNKTPFKTVPNLKITAQGGVCTSEEHNFLIEQYDIDSVGWGTPILLVPEASNVEDVTLDLLVKATEKDLYLSNTSPIGVPFNSLRTNTKDIERQQKIDAGKPGVNCTRKFLAYNMEYGELICTASRNFQSRKIKELDEKNLNEEEYKKQYWKIVDKSCICVGLGNSILLKNGLEPVEGNGVSICPGPNMAYFDKITTLKEMVSHIYGKSNLISRKDVPNFLIKEIKLYMDYLQNKIEQTESPFSDKDIKFFDNFINNMNDGINYYKNMFTELEKSFQNIKEEVNTELEKFEMKLNSLQLQYT
jgi:hypothetical protein